jgi:hypothetical protein
MGVIYTNINRLTHDDRKKYVEEPLAILNVAFDRSVGIDAFVPALRVAVGIRKNFMAEEVTLAAFVIASSSDCKQYVPVSAIRKCRDGFASVVKHFISISRLMRFARDPGNAACPVENRQNALFKRMVSKLNTTTKQKELCWIRRCIYKQTRFIRISVNIHG